MIVILFGLRGSGVDTAKAELQSLGVQVITYTEARSLIADRGDAFFEQPVLFAHLNREEAQAKARVGFVQYTNYSDFSEIVEHSRKYATARLVNVDNNGTVSSMTRALTQAIAELQEAVSGASVEVTAVTEIEFTHGLNTWRPKVSFEADGEINDQIAHVVADNNRVRCYFESAVTGTLRIRA